MAAGAAAGAAAPFVGASGPTVDGFGHQAIELARQIERFRLEARAIARLSSPNTIRLFDFGVTETGSLYFVPVAAGTTSVTVAAKDGAGNTVVPMINPTSQAGSGKVTVTVSP